MPTKRLIAISAFCFLCSLCSAQQVTKVYKIGGLLQRIYTPDTLFVVNFWATWCKPCVQELPSFDSLTVLNGKQKVKVLLVSLDFKEELEKKVNPFLQKHGIRSECVLLDEVNGNDFIDKIATKWTGAIPATLVKKGKVDLFFEKKLHLLELQKALSELQK